MTTEAMVVLYDAGWSHKAIGKVSGLSPTAVRYRLKRAGVVARPGRRARAALPPAAELATRHGAGESFEAIGRELGVSGQTVRNRLREAELYHVEPPNGRPGPRPGFDRPLPPAAAVAARRYGEGAGLERIAVECGSTLKTVARWLRRQGVPIRRAGRPSKAE
jgi:DNA-directed RNA polymerase specialized sigma24 family protein